MTKWQTLNMLVEGQTEEHFVKKIIKPHLENFQIETKVAIVKTRRDANKCHKGGGNYQQIKKDIRLWLNYKEAYLTTFFDYYGLPNDFPGIDKIKKSNSDPYQKVIHLQNAIADDIENPKQFIPYLQLHEFEGLLFSDVAIIDKQLTSNQSSKLKDLEKIIKQSQQPELINDSPETAPSKHLLKLYPGYEKITHSIIIAQEIGLTSIRKKCSHFDQWLNRLEQLNGK